MPDMSEDLSELKEALKKHFMESSHIKKQQEAILISLESSLRTIRHNRPNDRSELDRRWAIAITDFEKVIAYFKTYIVEEYMLSSVSQSPSKE